jgi:hypothetical protein
MTFGRTWYIIRRVHVSLEVKDAGAKYVLQKNLNIAWIDHEKAFDSVPLRWVIKS